MTADEKVIDRINKLLALAENAGTPEEAELAFAKAQEFMVKYAIDQALLGKADASKAEKIVTRRINLGQRDEIVHSKMSLYARLAEANQCTVVNATKSSDQVWIIGYESQAAFVEMLAASVLIQYAGERTKEWKAYQARYANRPKTPLSRFKWVNSFSYGYAQRIGERVKAQTTTTAKASKGTLVLRDRKADVDEWVAENLSLRQSRSHSRSFSFEASSQGREAANRADISGGRNNVRTRTNRQIG